MSVVVNLMSSWDRVKTQILSRYDQGADEVVAGLWYSFIQHRTLALEELPDDEQAPLQGPRDVKEWYGDFKKELLDLVDQIGRRLITGITEQLVVESARPFSRVPDFMGQISEALRTLARMTPSVPAVVTSRIAGTGPQNAGARPEQHFDDEDELGAVTHPQARTHQISALENQLSSLKDSQLACNIKALNRLSWQAASLKKRFVLYLFHMSSFFWGFREVVKAGYKDEKINMLLWGSTAFLSAFELGKSSSFSKPFSFRAYTPEKFALSAMKVMMVAFFGLQSCFTSFQNFGYQECLTQSFNRPFKRICYEDAQLVECWDRPFSLGRNCSQELDFSQKVDRVALNLFIAMGASFVMSLFFLTLMARGLERKIQKMEGELAHQQKQLTAQLDSLNGRA